MTYEEIKAEVARWPIPERLRLLEGISQSVRESLDPVAPNGTTGEEAAWREKLAAEREDLLKDVPPESSLHTVLGIAHTHRIIPMTKHEDRQVILEYLTEKYLR
jgi:hypothetical protein